MHFNCIFNVYSFLPGDFICHVINHFLKRGYYLIDNRNGPSPFYS